MSTESWCSIAFKAPANCRMRPGGSELQHHLAKVLKVALESVLIHARCQASHEDFFSALGVDIVRAPPRWLFFLWYSLLRLDLAPEL